MSTTRGVLYVHSAPSALCPHVEWAAGGVFGMPVHLDWTPQQIERASYRAEYSWTGPTGTGARLASALKGWQRLRFEVTEDPRDGVDGSRWLHTPDLGIFHAQTDAAGNIVVPEDRIRAAMDAAGTSAIELHRELRLALGQAWDDELEPFRHAIGTASVTWLHRSAV